MSILKTIPSKIKLLLSPGDKALYELNRIDSDLEMTDDGGSDLVQFLFDKYRKELGERAIKEVKEIKK